MPLAADYPLLEIFWTVAVFALWAVWLWAVIWSLMDNWRRTDHGGWAKATWTVVIIIVPIIGFIVYMISRPVREAGYNTYPDGYEHDPPRPTWRR